MPAAAGGGPSTAAAGRFAVFKQAASLLCHVQIFVFFPDAAKVGVKDIKVREEGWGGQHGQHGQHSACLDITGQLSTHACNCDTLVSQHA